MIWAKTDAGRIEMQTRALVKERARRNLLLLIDGTKSEEMLLASLAGISAEDFRHCARSALIAPVAGAGAPRHAPRRAATPAAPADRCRSAPAPLDYSQFTAALTQLISSQLGLRGFTLTLAVDKAVDDRGAARRRPARGRADPRAQGRAAAAEARKTLYGA